MFLSLRKLLSLCLFHSWFQSLIGIWISLSSVISHYFFSLYSYSRGSNERWTKHIPVLIQCAKSLLILFCASLSWRGWYGGQKHSTSSPGLSWCQNPLLWTAFGVLFFVYFMYYFWRVLSLDNIDIGLPRRSCPWSTCGRTAWRLVMGREHLHPHPHPLLPGTALKSFMTLQTTDYTKLSNGARVFLFSTLCRYAARDPFGKYLVLFAVTGDELGW